MSVDYRAIIIDRLNKLGIKGKELCAQLVKHGAIIAGSFALQCVLGEYYIGSDIDIFISHEGYYPHPIAHWLSNEYGICPNNSSSEEYISGVFKVWKLFISPKVIFNLIYIKHSDIAQFIEEAFDLSFCKTSFDGQNVRVTDLTLRKIGYIKPLERDEYEWFYDDDDAIDDMRKGVIKGNSDWEHWDTYDYRPWKLIERIIKYAQRGFYIYGQVDRPTLLERCNIGCFLRQNSNNSSRLDIGTKGSDATKKVFLQFAEKSEWDSFLINYIYRFAFLAPVFYYSLDNETIIPDWLF